MPGAGVKAGVCLAANARVQCTVFAKTKVCEITLRPIRSFALHVRVNMPRRCLPGSSCRATGGEAVNEVCSLSCQKIVDGIKAAVCDKLISEMPSSGCSYLWKSCSGSHGEPVST